METKEDGDKPETGIPKYAYELFGSLSNIFSDLRMRFAVF
jgi:hypothetical protein